eukprot:UN02368
MSSIHEMLCVLKTECIQSEFWRKACKDPVEQKNCAVDISHGLFLRNISRMIISIM